LFDFSVPEIAERAGVSHRTVYNYFENRQALLDALDEWSSKTMAAAGGVNAITSLDEIPPAIEVNFRLFGEQRGVSEAFARLDPAPSSELPTGRRRRTEMFLEAAVRELPDVDPVYGRALGGLLRSLGSSRLWYALTHEYEVADDVAADVMAWARADAHRRRAERSGCARTPHTGGAIMTEIIALAQAHDEARSGGKAAGLARLLGGGFAVPDGVVLPADLLSTWEPSRPAPDAVVTAVKTATEQLGAGPFAVRSSAVGEDGTDASYAGVFESILDVPADGVLDAVRRCLDAVRSARVEEYAGQRQVAMAVILQRMLAPTAAGVAFSADPVTGDRDRVRVSAVDGVADRLVAGEVDGDEWVVSTSGPERLTGNGAIDAATARRLADEVRRVEGLWGRPVDVEWALTGDDLWLVQARPITVLPTPPTETLPGTGWEKDVAHNPEPMTPFGTSTYLDMFDIAARHMCDTYGLIVKTVENRVVGGEVYIRVVPAVGTAGHQGEVGAPGRAARTARPGRAGAAASGAPGRGGRGGWTAHRGLRRLGQHLARRTGHAGRPPARRRPRRVGRRGPCRAPRGVQAALRTGREDPHGALPAVRRRVARTRRVLSGPAGLGRGQDDRPARRPLAGEHGGAGRPRRRRRPRSEGGPTSLRRSAKAPTTRSRRCGPWRPRSPTGWPRGSAPTRGGPSTTTRARPLWRNGRHW
jgi:AcrR family transcriptional regulator